MANRALMFRVTTVSIFIFLSSIGLYLLGRDASSQSEIQRLIRKTYDSQRPGGGRLSGASYTPPNHVSPTAPEVARAQVLLLKQPESPRRQDLQGTIYLATGDWQKFVELKKGISSARYDFETLNNLGVSYLALSEEDPSLLLDAIDAFKRASQIAPMAQEPLFNLVVSYRRLRFFRRANDTLKRYSEVDELSPWHAELVAPDVKDEAAIVDELESAVQKNNPRSAERLFKENPELCRRLVLDFANTGDGASHALLRFIADQMARSYGDNTATALVTPLLTDQREATLSIRRLVHEGASLYDEGKLDDSADAYSDAETLARTAPPFEQVWLDLSKVDTEIRRGRFEPARETLQTIIANSDQHGYLWIKAKALAIYGSSFRLTDSYSQMLDLLTKADYELGHLDAPHDRVRVLYYLAIYSHLAGDQEQALRVALRSLRLLDQAETVRISTFDWLIGLILFRRGTTDTSLLFAQEAVAQSHGGPYGNSIEFVSSSSLAQLYQALSDEKSAEQYLSVAEEAFKKIPPGYDQIRDELLLHIVKGKVKIAEKDYADAESLLQTNLSLYSKQPFKATPMLSESLMLLAKVYSDTGRVDEAAQKYREAIDVVEKDGEYLESEGLRVKFDDERRNLYDSAIEFELKNGSTDAAWNDLQRYRAKLFLEFLALFDPHMQPAWKSPNRAMVQSRIPKDTQVVEYALLKDQLLIWVVSDKVFTVRCVQVTRNDIESKVQAVLGKLRIGDNVGSLLTDLGKFLIDPVSDLLDPNRSLTIIPDRALHGLPFGALKQPGDTKYLIQRFPIVFTPSLTHLLTADAAQPARRDIVAFGSQNGGAEESKELTALGKIYSNATIVNGRQVDKSKFLDGLTNASIFHYAGHSATDASDPLRSSILLDGNRYGPNSVTAVDISRKRLVHNAVVILSSCDSSVGNSRDGIGVRGLTSAFLIGGAGSVVGSLWPVESSSTSDLMIRFHRAFSQSGMPVAKALRDAQLAFLESHPDKSNPYYWSGFVVTGNFSALR